MPREVPLVGGNVGTVVRVGDTVRRETGPWSPAVHQLLQHLEHVGFRYAPRFLGIDERGREVLTYIEGDTAGMHPWPGWVWSDDVLVQAGRILRDYHDAVASFRPAQPLVWRFATAAVGADTLVCHNDFAPYNIVVRDDRIVGIIDWDLAGPAPAVDDVAFAAWTFAPIAPPERARRFDAPTQVVRRIALLCDAYGLDDRWRIVDAVAARMRASIVGIAANAAAGEEAFVRLIRGGHLARMTTDAEFLERHRSGWQRELRRRRSAEAGSRTS